MRLLALALIVAGSLRAQDFVAPLPDDDNSNPVLARADKIFAEVSRLRGLPIKTPVLKKIENRDFFYHYFSDALAQQYPVQKKAALEKAYVFYGFMVPGTDLVESYRASLLKNVQGLYDPRTKTLYLAEWVGEDIQEEVLAHELTHALQDQYFDLQAYVNQERDGSMDYQFAHDSVMEGEAVAIALNYSLEGKGTDFTQLKDIGSATRLFDQLNQSGQRAFGRRVALPDVADFPYVYGTAFLQKYVRVYGWEGMGYLFKHPPTSTHQILHPETFFPQRHNPLKVEIEDLSKGVLKGRDRIWRDSLGEYGLYLVLGQFLPSQQVWRAVRGWQGDRFQLYENPSSGNLIGIGYVVLEDKHSASDFFGAACSQLLSKYHIDSVVPKEGAFFQLTLGGTGLQIAVERRGRRVIVIEGTEVGETTKVRSALWEVKRQKSLMEKVEAPRASNKPGNSGAGN